MWENFVFLVIFDTYDVVYNWFISLLPPIVLDNLFVVREPWVMFLPNCSCEEIIKYIFTMKSDSDTIPRGKLRFNPKEY